MPFTSLELDNSDFCLNKIEKYVSYTNHSEGKFEVMVRIRRSSVICLVFILAIQFMILRPLILN